MAERPGTVNDMRAFLASLEGGKDDDSPGGKANDSDSPGTDSNSIGNLEFILNFRSISYRWIEILVWTHGRIEKNQVTPKSPFTRARRTRIFVPKRVREDPSTTPSSRKRDGCKRRSISHISHRKHKRIQQISISPLEGCQPLELELLQLMEVLLHQRFLPSKWVAHRVPLRVFNPLVLDLARIRIIPRNWKINFQRKPGKISKIRRKAMGRHR